jgi:uncharacterized protein YdeI (BOF family)
MIILSIDLFTGEDIMNLQTYIKQFLIIVLSLVICFVFSGCKGNDEANRLANKIQLLDIDEISGTFSLPKFVENDTNARIIWTSNKPNIIYISEFPEWDHKYNHNLYYMAKVTLPEEATEVELKAEVTYGKEKATRVFTVNVIRNEYHAMTIAKVKELTNQGEKVEIEGVVTFIGKDGYAIKDVSGTIFICDGKDVNIGDKMLVKGVFYCKQNNPQIMLDYQEQIDSILFNPDKAAEAMELKTIQEHDEKDITFYGKLVKVKGIIKDNQDSNLPYKLVNPFNPSEFVCINKNCQDAVLKALYDNLNKYIETIALIYDNNSGAFSIIISNTFTENDFVISDEDEVNMALAFLIEKWTGTVVTENLNLEKYLDSYGTVVSWESKNPEVLTSDGKVGMPTKDTTVTFTITVAKNNTKASGKVEVVVKKITPMKIKKILEQTPKSALDEKVSVLLEGKVIGYQSKGYWVSDDTGAIFVFTNKENTFEEPFPEIGEMVLIKGELTTYGENYCFTAQVNLLNVMKITSTEMMLLDPIDLTFEQIYALNITSYEKAREVAMDYYGKFITITGKVMIKDNLDKLCLVSINDSSQKIYVSSNSVNVDLVDGQIITVTLLIEDIYYANDASTSQTYNQGTFGCIYFQGEALR